MVEGIKIELKTDELRDHLIARAHHHRDKAAQYAQQARAVDLPEDVTQTLNPQQSLEHMRRKHKRQADYYDLLANRLIPNEVYRLSDADLIRLELISEGF